MKNILVIGAGRSSTALIHYLLDKSEQYGWFVSVADADPQQAEKKVNGHPNGRAIWLDVMKPNDRKDILSRVDIVVSLLPAHLHLQVAQDCIKLRKHLITASYVSREMYRLGDEARDASLIFMGEMGLDPGIDHMSAMQTLDRLRDEGCKLISFKSYAGGIVAPESDDNPWHYKFSWNPRNVVLAGQGTAQYLENNKLRCVPYHRLFASAERIDIPGFQPLDAYPNRDSLLYRSIYGLDAIPNLLRATLRYPEFCDAWHALIKIGLTDGSYPLHESDQLTYHEWIASYLPQGPGSVKERCARFLGLAVDSRIMQQIEWLGLFRKKKIKVENATPALLLENLLLKKWKMRSNDRDMIVMQHEFEYETKEGKQEHLTSTMLMKGEDAEDTAMARLVGLPMGIFVRLIAEGKISTTGVQIPIMREVYEPVLEELQEYGVSFEERIR